MKKSLIVAASLASLSFSSAAQALNTQAIREIHADGLPLSSFLGAATFTALGALQAVGGSYCAYLMNWTSPYNPNDVSVCILREQRTPVKPSCLVNSMMDITSFVSAGAGGGGTYCAGYDNLGFPRPRVTLLLGESPLVPLQGIAVYEGALPLVLGILVL